MYSESFFSCYSRCKNFIRQLQPTIHYNLKYSNVFTCIGNFTYSGTGDVRPLASSGKIFKFKGASNFSYRVFPGSSLSIPFSVYDDFNTRVIPLLSIAKLDPTSEVSVAHRYTLSNQIYLAGKPNSSSKFTITTISLDKSTLCSR